MASRSSGSHPGGDLGPAQIAEHGGHGGLLATLVSGIALIFSGLSYYESSMKRADLEVYVPPMIHYARDGDNDVFNIPITIANDGARSGLVLGMELEVENPKPSAPEKKKSFHSIFIGEYPRDDNTVSRSFAPLSIAGHGTFSETVRFYPSGKQLPFVVDDAGEFHFTLKLLTAKPANPNFIDSWWRTEPEPITFTLTLPYLSVQHLTFRHGTVAMYNKNWQAAVSSSTEPAAISRKMPKPELDEKPAEPPPPKTPEQKTETTPPPPAPAKPATPALAPAPAAKK